MPRTSLKDSRGPASSVRRTGRVAAVGFSLVWLVIALGIGVAVGLAVGATVRALSSPSIAWADLAAVILGMFAGVLAAMTLWFIAMVRATRRFVPVGRRLGVLGWSALVVVASLLVGYGWFALVGDAPGARASVISIALLAMVLAPVALVAARVSGAGPTASAADGSMTG